MTYLLFVNGKYFSSTRSNEEAFRWRKEWGELGHNVGLKFVRDNDKEAFKWLVPPVAARELRAA